MILSRECWEIIARAAMPRVQLFHMHERDKIVRDEFDYAFIIRWVSNKHYYCVYRRFLKSMVIIDFSKSFPVDQSECLLETHRMIMQPNHSAQGTLT